MKRILLTVLFAIFTITACAQEHRNKNVPLRVIADRDTVEMNVNNEKKRVEIIFEMGEESVDHDMKRGITIRKEEKTKGSGNEVKYPTSFGGLTFSNFDLGLTQMLDNGKGSLSPQNEFLKYRRWKSVNVGFDVVQIGYSYSDEFRIVLSAGFDWTHFRLKSDIVIKEDTSPLEYETSDIHYSKNRFSSSYLRIPLTFEYRTHTRGFPGRLRYSFGPIAGILLQGSQKFKSKEEGKTKNIDDFNYAPFRYGAFARVNFGGLGLYGKYYFNDMFENSPAQEGLKNLSFGLMFYF
jgi:hypothetical protein